MKKNIFILITLISLLIFSGCEQHLPVIKIGVFESLTGENHLGGCQELLGIQYANSLKPTVKIGNKKYKVKLITIDNCSDVKKAYNAAQNLAVKNVDIVLGSFGSSVSIAGGEIFSEKNIPVIGLTCSNPRITYEKPNSFRICFTNDLQGAVLANFANKEIHAKKAYCLAKKEDEYSTDLCTYFIRTFMQTGGDFLYETYPEGVTDFSPYIETAIESKADVLFMTLSSDGAPNIINYLSENNIHTPVLSGDTWDSSTVLENVQDKDVDIYITTHFIADNQEKGSKQFISGIEEYLKNNKHALELNSFSTEISAPTAMGFDGYNLCMALLEKCPDKKRNTILKNLKTIEYEGISGKIIFDYNGDAVKNFAYIKKADSKLNKWQFISLQEILNIE